MEAEFEECICISAEIRLDIGSPLNRDTIGEKFHLCVRGIGTLVHQSMGDYVFCLGDYTTPKRMRSIPYSCSILQMFSREIDSDRCDLQIDIHVYIE